ncbi:MAG: PTS system mannose/fructose/sorbose family transporter subunit IID, partial [Erysipelotrichaceae bacterium]|nr:PTS system mannose/fructose/sorbose family transporter subunit IID [Erysipelotrichaceae bacterium]
NSQPYMSSIILGAALGMEQELGTEGADAIQNFKVGLMGPTAGIGDSIFWIILPAIFTPIAAASAYDGSYVGLVIYTLYEIILAIFRFRFFGWGFELGGSIITKFRKQISVLTDAASVLGLTVLGAMIPSTVTVTCPLEFTFSTGSVVNIQGLLNSICPNILPLGIVMACAAILGKKKVSMTSLVLVVLVVSVIGASLNILG